MRVVTVTLNPAVDKTLEVERLIPEALNKVIRHRSDIGGKGINVSRVLKALGTESIATGFIAGGTGKAVTDGLERMGIAHNMKVVQGETRTNLKVFDCTTRQITEINEPGPEADESDLMDLAYGLATFASEDCLFVFSGSIPRGLDENCYSGLIENVKARGAKVFLDADNEAFKLGVEAKPDIIKPNKAELERFFGKALTEESDVLMAMKHFIDKGIEHVFVTMGNQGAYYSSRHDVYKMKPLTVDAHSSVGAGDAFVGAVCHSIVNGYDVEKMLRWCVATSAGAVVTIGTNPANLEWVLENISKVVVNRIGGES